MGNSSIYRERWGAGSAFAVAVGRQLRAARRARGLTQAHLGNPLSGAFVSAVERGEIVPSLPSLALLVSRLGLRLATFFRAVEDGFGGHTT
jgi:transcriptional regulator with XRE-family HTH domain